MEKIYEGITTLATDKDNNIYVFEVGQGIKVFDSEGIQKRVLEIQYAQLTNNFTIALNGDIYFVSGGFRVFSPDGQIITKLNLPNGEAHHIILTGNKIYALAGSYSYDPKTQAIVNGTSVIKLTNSLSGM
jgi:sugar lactone lactonase YvrE